MKLPTYLLPLVLVTMAANPVTPHPQSGARLEPFGLEGKRVTALGISPQAAPLRQYLYAATEDDGVYRRPLHPDSMWISMGLERKYIPALDIQVWGAGPAIFHAPAVGVQPDYDHGDSTLVYRLEDNRWIPADSGITKKSSIKSLTSFASSGHEPPGATFAAGGSLIYRSNSWSRWWTKIFDGGIGLSIYVIAVNQSYEHNEVWVGGIDEGAIAWMAKSTDNGETWENFYLPTTVLDNNACYSLAIHPDSSNIVYAGMHGAVIKTTDGGKNWRLTGLEKNQADFHGLALDSFNPNHLYAGGATSANQWALWESLDGGVRWQEISAPQSIWSIEGISSIVADPNAPGAIYIGTLGGGMWHYQSGVVAVKGRREEISPQGYMLEQNYPNPFSTEGKSRVAENSDTIIRFEIPSSLADSPAHLAIYNLRGELVRELLSKKLPAGNYSVQWEGDDDAGREAASGIYLYRLQVGNVSEMRKLSLLK